MTRPLRLAPEPTPQALQAAALRDLLAALDVLARKHARHRRCGWQHIKVGALDQVIDTYRQVVAYPDQLNTSEKTS